MSAVNVPGRCGMCGIATDRLPCWNCELEARIRQQPDPCATCDRPEDDHAHTCPLSPRYVADPIPSDIPGTATQQAAVERELLVCPAEEYSRCQLTGPFVGPHLCTFDDGHSGGHECGCGHRWTEADV